MNYRIFLLILLFPAVFQSASADIFPRHASVAGGNLNKFRPVMSFDSDNCAPVAAVKKSGAGYIANPGLNDRDPSKNCDTKAVGNNTQAYGVETCQTRGRGSNRAKYCAYTYGFYFEKDRAKIFTTTGHTHDWEHVIVWVKNGVPEFLTTSDHAGTEQYDLRDNGSGDTGVATNLRITDQRYHVRYYRTDGDFSTNSFKIVTTNQTDWETTDYRLTPVGTLGSDAKKVLETADYGKAVQRIAGSNLTNYLKSKQPNETGWQSPMQF